MTQLGLFDTGESFHLTDKKIRLITLFSGYDSQALALKYLNIPFEHYKTCEWAIPSIKALYDLHFNDVNHRQESLIPFEDLCNFYAQKLSKDYSNPLNYAQICKLGEKELREIDFCVNNSNNLLNICYIHGQDLEIVDKDEYNYILTYSFPCQDLSRNGKRQGMEENSKTRSSLLWEVGRLLDELNNLDALPQVLLMENVPQVLGSENVKEFSKWLDKLEYLGYKNYYKILNAKDYGVPQNRARCYMVSILGDYTYYFPEPLKQRPKLKSILETDVPEKYFISKLPSKNDLKPYGAYFTWPDKKGNMDTQSNRARDENKYSLTLCATRDIKVLIPSKKVLLQETAKKLDLNSDNPQYLDCYNKKVQKIARTITTRVYDSNLDFIYNDYRIRKLTPMECFRLMGVKDADYYKIKEHQTERGLYHMTGDSIVIDVLMAIFKELL